METVKKYWLWGVFISILSIFAMSHNASAVDFTINLSNYELVQSLSDLSVKCAINSTTLGNNVIFCGSNSVISGGSYLNKIIYGNDFSVSRAKVGDYIEWYLVVLTNQNYSLRGAFKGPQYFYFYNYLETLSFEQVSDTSFYFNDGQICNNDGSSNYTCTTTDGYKFFKVYRVVQRIKSEPTDRWTFGIIAPGSNKIFEYYESIPDTVRFKMFNFNQYRFVGSEENKEVEEKTQGAVDDSQAVGGSSSQDAQTGTTGLLNAITGAVSVISSASPTNCKINGNMGNLDMGQLDLCANPAPAFIQTIGSLILILMCVPLAISLFNRFIAIFRSFQS